MKNEPKPYHQAILTRTRLYHAPRLSRTSMRINQSKEGETIEQKIERIVANKEPIKDGAPLLYTERKEGIRPSVNIRTDRWEHAIDATEKIAKSYKARRESKPNTPGAEGETGGQPIQGKEGNPSTDTK